ncbi:MAG TPA: corrinoid protein [Oscillospiraceae bacterium]|nr:corrinoid protein [Oscillospiraceae bacterium]
MADYESISLLLQQGRKTKVIEAVQAAMDEGDPAQEILDEGLIAGMNVVGERFKNNEVFVPEVLISARAMNAGVEVLKPALTQDGVASKGTAVIGTVQGDMHDIGKNLVRMMLEGKGLKVVDLGVDVSPERFVEAAAENDADVICCSALLTTTMGVMADVVKLAKEKGVRAKVLVGGSPLTQAYCDAIGADGYSPDAASASDLALSFCG